MTEVTEEDIKFDQLTEEYWERFHKSYGILWGDSKPLSYHIGVMEDALRTGIPAKIEEYPPDLDVIV